jgi:transcriptional regulator with XRE-family HTH domain
MGLHMGKAMRGRQLKLLDEASLPFRAVHGAPWCVEDGWLRSVRVAVGIPVEELALRLGVQPREVFRLETAEKESRITLAALKRAAEALDCELMYGLTPKEGTLVEMAAERSTARERALHAKRLAADDRRVAEGKPRRMRDPQLGAIDELLRLAGLARTNNCTERLRSSVDRRVGRHAGKIVGALTDKALEGNMGAIKDLLRIVGAVK